MPCTCGSPTKASASARRRPRKATSTSRAIVVGLRDHRRRRHPSGLRIPVGERALRRDPRGARHHLHRPHARASSASWATRSRPRTRRRRLGMPRRAGLRRRSIDNEERGAPSRREIGYPVLVKAAAGGGGRGMKVVRSTPTCLDALSAARARGQGGLRRRRASTSRSIWSSRATSRSRCSATARATSCIWASATARCSAATRRFSEEAPSPALNDDAAQEHRQARSPRRMQKLEYRGAGTVEFLLPGRRVLFHRDEHAPAGRAPGDGDDHRHRPRERADPHRRRRPLSVSQKDVTLLGPRDRVPHQRREPRDLHALARHDHLLPPARADWACGSTAASTRAIASRPTTTA